MLKKQIHSFGVKKVSSRKKLYKRNMTSGILSGTVPFEIKPFKIECEEEKE